MGEIDSFIRLNFPQGLWFLTGSYARNTYNQGSDVDICLVSRARDHEQDVAHLACLREQAHREQKGYSIYLFCYEQAISEPSVVWWSKLGSAISLRPTLLRRIKAKVSRGLRSYPEHEACAILRADEQQFLLTKSDKLQFEAGIEWRVRYAAPILSLACGMPSDPSGVQSQILSTLKKCAVVERRLPELYLRHTDDSDLFELALSAKNQVDYHFDTVWSDIL